jgi:hypothetical protein
VVPEPVLGVREGVLELVLDGLLGRAALARASVGAEASAAADDAGLWRVLA